MLSLQNLSQRVNRAALRLADVNYDQYLDAYRMPENPKILIFGANKEALSPLFATVFEHYQLHNYGSLLKLPGNDKEIINPEDAVTSPFIFSRFPSSSKQMK